MHYLQFKVFKLYLKKSSDIDMLVLVRYIIIILFVIDVEVRDIC